MFPYCRPTISASEKILNPNRCKRAKIRLKYGGISSGDLVPGDQTFDKGLSIPVSNSLRCSSLCTGKDNGTRNLIARPLVEGGTGKV